MVSQIPSLLDHNRRDNNKKKPKPKLRSFPSPSYLQDLLKRLLRGQESRKKISHFCTHQIKNSPPSPLSLPTELELRLVAALVCQALQNPSELFKIIKLCDFVLSSSPSSIGLGRWSAQQSGESNTRSSHPAVWKDESECHYNTFCCYWLQGKNSYLVSPWFAWCPQDCMFFVSLSSSVLMPSNKGDMNQATKALNKRLINKKDDKSWRTSNEYSTKGSHVKEFSIGSANLTSGWFAQGHAVSFQFYNVADLGIN